MTLLDETRIVWAYAAHPEARWEQADDLVDAVESALDLAEADGLDAAYIVAGQYPDPEELVRVDLEDLLQKMDEDAHDNGLYCGDDPLFEADEDAARALDDALRAWAREYVSVTAWTAAAPIRITRRPSAEAA